MRASVRVKQGGDCFHPGPPRDRGTRRKSAKFPLDAVGGYGTMRAENT